jgi:DNA-binding CsgD family transcriptional regulator
VPSDVLNNQDSLDPGGFSARIAQLTERQIECLRLVDQHLSSKEIGAELRISPHTVDQRIRGALQTLGVERRAQAARLVRDADPQYQRLIYQSPDIETPAPPFQSIGAVGKTIRHADRAGGVEPSGFDTEQRLAGLQPPLQLPFATRNNPRNRMSVSQRLFWILMIAIGALFSAGMYLAGLESLARLIDR